jgi:hypothetical protein
MPQPLSEAALQSLTEALLQGRKIEAIKQYRKLTGLDLKTSVEQVEEIETLLRLKYPDKFAARPKTSGCSGQAALLLGGLIFACWALRR